MEPIDYPEKIVEVPLTHHSGAMSPPCQRVTKKMMDILEDGGTKAGGLCSVGIISTSGAQAAEQDFKDSLAERSIRRASYFGV